MKILLLVVLRILGWIGLILFGGVLISSIGDTSPGITGVKIICVIFIVLSIFIIRVGKKKKKQQEQTIESPTEDIEGSIETIDSPTEDIEGPIDKNMSKGSGNFFLKIGKVIYRIIVLILGIIFMVLGSILGSGSKKSSRKKRKSTKKKKSYKQQQKKMTSWGKTKKICATCDYWGGDRKADPAPPLKPMKVIDVDQRGFCAIKKIETSHGAQCNKHKIWGIIR